MMLAWTEWLALAGLFGFVWWLVRGRRHRRRCMPAGSPRPERTTRAAETVIMGLAALLVLFLLSFENAHTPCLLAMAARYPRASGLAWALFGGTAVLMLLCLIPALRGRSLVSMLALAVLLTGYGIFLDNVKPVLGRFMSPRTFLPVAVYTLDVSGEDIPDGAELWVNNVYLGRTPVTMGLDDFYEKVPFWDAIPAEFNGPQYQVAVTTRGPTVRHVEQKSTWIEFEPPTLADLDPLVRRFANRPLRRKYYARVRQRDQWGYGRYAGGGSNGNAGCYEIIGEIFVQFAEPIPLVDRLLDQGRVRDYQVGPEWFAAMESLDPAGYNALKRAIQAEPRWASVLDAWAGWRYELNTATDPESAWGVFRRICDEANIRKAYHTQSLAGRAVELLVPHLDPAVLVEAAKKAIETTKHPTYTWSQNEGRIEFGSYILGRRGSPGSGDGGEIDFSIHALAHAIWTLDQRLDAQIAASGSTAGHPHIVEQRIPAALLRHHHQDQRALEIANALGGCPDLDRFLLRQPWDVQFKGSDMYDNMIAVRGRWCVNRWLYLLANLDSSAGLAFRAQHRREIMEMADAFLADGFAGTKLPSFLFVDMDQGAKSLTAEYWPRLLGLNLDRFYAFKLRLEYLLRMEPVSSTEMYLEALRAGPIDIHSFGHGISALQGLPDSRRREILEAFVSDMRARRDQPGLSEIDDTTFRIMLQQAERNISGGDRQAEASSLMKEWQATAFAPKRDEISGWLEHDAPDHPLVGMLADSDDPQLRILVMGALRAHPAPANRAILDRLLADPDPQVQSAARQVRADLDTLAATPPGELIRPRND